MRHSDHHDLFHRHAQDDQSLRQLQVNKSLKLPNSKLSCKVKRKRLNRGAGYCLKIPVIYTFVGYKKVIKWIKSKTQEDIKLEQSMKNRCFK